MTPRVRWGLIAGGVLALLNLCGGTLIGIFNNCLILLTVAAGAGAAGYLSAREEPAAEAQKSGAIAGAIAGGLSLVGQLVGAVIGGIVGTSILASLNPELQQVDPSQLAGGAAIGVVASLATSLCVGVVMIAVGAGIGALTARLAAQSPTPPPPVAGNPS